MLFNRRKLILAYWITLFLLISATSINAHAKIWFKGSPDTSSGSVAFMKLNNKNHRIWWNTGFILARSIIGYRYILEHPYMGQNWFLGSFLAYDYYTYCHLNNTFYLIYRGNLGIELFGSRFGQLSINVYKVPYIEKLGVGSNSIDIADFDFTNEELIFRSLTTIDDYGVSIKWLTVPHQSSLQGSIMLAHTHVRQKDPSWFKTHVNRFGVGVQYTLFNALHVEMQYMFFDRYQKGLHIGLCYEPKSVGRYENNLIRQINRSADRHIPFYRSYQNNFNRSSFNRDNFNVPPVELEFAELTQQSAQTIRECSADQLKKWYRQASLKIHPDKQSGKSVAELKVANENFKRLSTCYEILLKRKQT